MSNNLSINNPIKMLVKKRKVSFSKPIKNVTKVIMIDESYTDIMPTKIYKGDTRFGTPLYRLLLRLDTLNPNKCWNYTGFKNPQGYGKIGYNDKIVFTHRLMWELVFGLIPDDLCVLHECDNPSCCNPKHLFLGTLKDNTADMYKKGRANRPNGEDVKTHKLTEVDVYAIKRMLSEGVEQLKIAQIFRVTQVAISYIKNEKRWKHVKFE